MAQYDYDLFVIGSGPGGERAAIAASKAGKLVAVAERRAGLAGFWDKTGRLGSSAPSDLRGSVPDACAVGDQSALWLPRDSTT